jgi:hypothetical protein
MRVSCINTSRTTNNKSRSLGSRITKRQHTPPLQHFGFTSRGSQFRFKHTGNNSLCTTCSEAAVNVTHTNTNPRRLVRLSPAARASSYNATFFYRLLNIKDLQISPVSPHCSPSFGRYLRFESGRFQAGSTSVYVQVAFPTKCVGDPPNKTNTGFPLTSPTIFSLHVESSETSTYPFSDPFGFTRCA